MRWISRAQWGARPPKSTPVIVPWSQREGVAYHLQVGNRANGPRELQDYAMDSLGYSDSHYNLATKDGNVFEMRGVTVRAAHAATKLANHNTGWIGVVVFGRDADVTDLDLRTLGEIHRYIESQAGRSLKFAGHKQLYGSQTSCPDGRIMNWLAAGGPRGETTMGILSEPLGSPAVAEEFHPRWANQPLGEWLKSVVPAEMISRQNKETLARIEARLAELATPEIVLTPEQINQLGDRIGRAVLLPLAEALESAAHVLRENAEME